MIRDFCRISEAGKSGWYSCITEVFTQLSKSQNHSVVGHFLPRENQVALLSGYELVDLMWLQVLSLSEVITSFIVVFVPSGWNSNCTETCKHRNESSELTKEVMRVLAHQQDHFIYS